MITTIPTLWKIIESNLKKGKWYIIDEIYQVVEQNYDDFTPDDLKSVIKGSTGPVWKRNVRNAFQSRRKTGDILYAGNAMYQIPWVSRHTFDSENLIWVKNVKRDNGEGWAYLNLPEGESFLLNWPTSKPGSAEVPNIGDVILLFQKPNKINGKKNYDVHLTHLVSPISDELIIDPNSPSHKWAREVIPLATTNPIESIPNPWIF